MLEFQSEAPDLVGSRCAGVLAQEFWYEGERVSPANVLFLGVESPKGPVWHRIVLDSGLVFWRVERAPSLLRSDDDSSQYGLHPIVDLGARHGFIGRQIAAVRVMETPDADELLLEFEGAPTLALRDVRSQDATELEIRPPAA
jgi:hypothetical protein